MSKKQYTNEGLPPELQVDEKQVRRESISSGAWGGMKKGMFWSGIAAAVMGGIGTLMAVPVIGAAVGATCMIPLLCPALAAIATLTGISLGAGGIAAAAGSAALSALTIIVPAALAVLAVGAVIGGVIGAVKGYNQSEDKIKLAYRQAHNEMRQIELEQQQTQARQQELEAKEGELQQQTETLYNQQGSQIGQMPSPTTPLGNNNNRLGEDKGAQPVNIGH